MKMMVSNKINFNLINLLVTSKMNVPEKMYALNDASLEYLKKLLEIYNNDKYENNINKYIDMLDVVEQQSVTKICRDIRMCITNLSRTPYIKEYDNSENELSKDMQYILMIIQYNIKNDDDLL